jgi:putative alpha-1,2-mannosidase
VKINVNGNNEITGTRTSHAWADSQIVYFVIQFSKPFKKFGLSNGPVLHQGLRKLSDTMLKSYVSFETAEGETILVKVGISAVSIDGARKNLDAELPGWDFDKVVKDAKTAWNKELGKIEVQSTDTSVMRTFYSAMYHAMIPPNIYQDVDGKYRGRDLQVHETKDFNYYTVFSLWDTCRGAAPAADADRQEAQLRLRQYFYHPISAGRYTACMGAICLRDQLYDRLSLCAGDHGGLSEGGDRV